VRHDDLLRPPGRDLEEYAEFAGVWLELRHFAPSPGRPCSPRWRPEKIEAHPPGTSTPPRCSSAAAGRMDGSHGRDRSGEVDGADVLGGEHVRAPGALSRARRRRSAPTPRGRGARGARATTPRRVLAATGATPRTDAARRARRAAPRALREARRRGSPRRCAARGRRHRRRRRPGWTSLLLLLRSRPRPAAGLRYPVEARLLYDLQAAAVAAERPRAASTSSRGRSRSASARSSARSWRRSPSASCATCAPRSATPQRPPLAGDRKLLARSSRGVRAEREEHRSALRRASSGLAEVGLKPRNVPERWARQARRGAPRSRPPSGLHLDRAAPRRALAHSSSSRTSTAPSSSSRATRSCRRRAPQRRVDGVYKRASVPALLQRSRPSRSVRTSDPRDALRDLPFGAAFVTLKGVGT